MIAPPNYLPHVLWRNSRLVPLSEIWLADSIQEAATKAGYAEWDLAPHIARAITVYLEEEFNRNTITVPQLQEMLTESIGRIGFQDVAAKTELISPKVSISLRELARRSTMELLFFPLLHQKMEDVLEYEARGLIFEDLKLCVKILNSSSRWQQSYDELRDRIVDYIRGYMGQHLQAELRLVIV